MKTLTLTAAMMGAALFVAASSFAQTAQATKQRTQEGAPAISDPCSLPWNANPTADPDCKRHTQNLVPTSGMQAPK
jgi:hypothetical protein